MFPTEIAYDQKHITVAKAHHGGKVGNWKPDAIVPATLYT
jgi:hypothetical protein